MSEIQHVSDYLKLIEIVRDEYKDEDIVVYRGENQIFSTACQPNLFRMNYMKNNPFFEKNILDEMAADKWTKGHSYLMKAVDAQHGGFPSRLLDVSYNALSALYFAVTPYFTKRVTEDDDKDGIVYIFDFEQMYCALGHNMESLFDSIVTRGKDKKWLWENKAFQLNHKLIDHIKANNRIIAQQGAFILFQGDEFTPISEYIYDKIIIPKNSKKTIRLELNRFFGIHTGSIYPEGMNCVDVIIEKSTKLYTNDFNEENEMHLFSDGFNKLIHSIEDMINNISDLTYEDVQDIEEKILVYKHGFEEITKHLDEEATKELIASYHKGLHRINDSIYTLHGNTIELSVNDLEIHNGGL
ncbi:FRG domain-containing protein [Amedibacillus sp. YH-ame10]